MQQRDKVEYILVYEGVFAKNRSTFTSGAANSFSKFNPNVRIRTW